VSEQVAARIRRAIEERGPITFAEYMEHALYGPGAFYERPAVGMEGHFLTSPHVHPIFAELLLRALVSLGDALGATDPLSVVEVGAGDGTLARELLQLAGDRGDRRLDYIAVERSATARARLSELNLRVAAHVRDLPPMDRGIVFANELLDNLPFRRIRATATGPIEVRVDVAGGRFVEVEVPCDPELARWAGDLPAAQEVALPIDAFELLDSVAGSLASGYVLLIDYGEATGLGGEVHGYRDHRPWDDVLREPGSADITTGVDFRAIARHAVSRGLASLGLVTQRDALLSLGYAEWDRDQRERQVRMLGDASGARAARIWEGRGRASLLVDPAQLGSLRWLLLATEALPRPKWLSTVQTSVDSGTSRRSQV
jgi:SAM-dependent MidA family methyltransferase